MPVKSSQNYSTRPDPGFNPMTEVLQGYLYGEEVQRQRFVEEREYGFRREQFDEKVRQYDTSLEEQIHQFDTRMAYSAEQADLDREHQVSLQDDAQAFAHVETALERTSREEAQQKQLAYQYHHTKKQVEQQNLDRGLQYDENIITNYKRMLGGNATFDDIADFLVEGRSGETYTPQQLKEMLPIELQKIANGAGSDILNLDAQAAQSLLKEYEKSGNDPNMIANHVATWLEHEVVFTKVVPNVDKEAGLRQIMLLKKGGSEETLDGMDRDDYERLRRATIYDMNNLQDAEDLFNRRSLDYQARQLALDVGIEGNLKTPYSSLAAANGRMWIWNNKLDIPTVTELANGTRIGQESVQMTIDAANIITMGRDHPDWDDDRILEEQAKLQLQLKVRRDSLAEMIKQTGADPKQADEYYDEMQRMVEGTSTPGNWGVGGLRKASAPAKGTAKGDKKGRWDRELDPNAPGYAELLKARKLREGRAASEEKTGVAAVSRQEKENRIAELETAKVQANMQSNIERFETENPDASTEDVKVFKEFTKQHGNRGYEVVQARYLAYKAGLRGVEELEKASRAGQAIQSYGATEFFREIEEEK